MHYTRLPFLISNFSIGPKLVGICIYVQYNFCNPALDRPNRLVIRLLLKKWTYFHCKYSDKTGRFACRTVGYTTCLSSVQWVTSSATDWWTAPPWWRWRSSGRPCPRSTSASPRRSTRRGESTCSSCSYRYLTVAAVVLRVTLGAVAWYFQGRSKSASTPH